MSQDRTARHTINILNSEVMIIATIKNVERTLELECRLSKRDENSRRMSIYLLRGTRRLLLADGLTLTQAETQRLLDGMRSDRAFLFSDGKGLFQLVWHPGRDGARTEWWFDAQGGAPLGYCMTLPLREAERFARELKAEAESPRAAAAAPVAMVQTGLLTCHSA